MSYSKEFAKYSHINAIQAYRANRHEQLLYICASSLNQIICAVLNWYTHHLTSIYIHSEKKSIASVPGNAHVLGGHLTLFSICLPPSGFVHLENPVARGACLR